MRRGNEGYAKVYIPKYIPNCREGVGWEYAERVFSSATPGACVQFKAKRSRIQEQMRNIGSMMDCNPLETVTLRGGAQPYPGCRPGFSRGQTPPRQVGRRGRARATGITPHNP